MICVSIVWYLIALISLISLVWRWCHSAFSPLKYPYQKHHLYCRYHKCICCLLRSMMDKSLENNALVSECHFLLLKSFKYYWICFKVIVKKCFLICRQFLVFWVRLELYFYWWSVQVLRHLGSGPQVVWPLAANVALRQPPIWQWNYYPIEWTTKDFNGPQLLVPRTVCSMC